MSANDWYIAKYKRGDWAYEEAAHKICFLELRDKSLNTWDFVYTAERVNEGAHGYFTVHIMDSESAYIQHGGVFLQVSGTVQVYKNYCKMLDEVLKDFKRITTKIENWNSAMLRMALKAGFVVTGVDNFKGKIFVCLLMERASEYA